uniref:Uncharacterized protein n=1 Tax=Anguilla anguilla TaxID=7936 RepID=A0A0E9WS47_ANGAN
MAFSTSSARVQVSDSGYKELLCCHIYISGREPPPLSEMRFR